MRKLILSIATAGLAAVVLAASPAMAHHKPGHGKGKGKGADVVVVKPGGHVVGYKRGGGPPPWAPAHGYRRKHGGDVEVVADYASPFDINVGRCNRDLLGAAIGGVTGAAIGSQFGKGDGKTAAIIGGTIVGAVIGGAIGRSMDDVDQHCVGQILEHAPDGEAVAWNNDANGQQYQVKPVATNRDASGRYCREYQTTSVIGGRAQQTYGTACRQPDGSWQLIN